MKGDLRIVPCSLRKANDFVAVYHRHSKRTARNGGKFAIGIAAGNQVIGIAIVGNPLSATYMDGVTAEVLRTCVIPNPPKNCNSLLYGTCRRIWFEMGGRKILTYTLTYESGASLRGAGWTLAAEIKGHNTTTWGKNDHLTTRKQQDIIGERKYRWEAINANFIACEPIWPIKVDALSMKPTDEQQSMIEEEKLIDAGVLEPNFGPTEGQTCPKERLTILMYISPKPFTVRLKVLRADIMKGRPRTPDDCPIAHSVTRAFKTVVARVSVTYDHIAISLVDGSWYRAELTARAQKFACNFDALSNNAAPKERKQFEPFEFTVRFKRGKG